MKTATATATVEALLIAHCPRTPGVLTFPATMGTEPVVVGFAFPESSKTLGLYGNDAPVAFQYLNADGTPKGEPLMVGTAYAFSRGFWFRDNTTNTNSMHPTPRRVAVAMLERATGLSVVPQF